MTSFRSPLAVALSLLLCTPVLASGQVSGQAAGKASGQASARDAGPVAAAVASPVIAVAVAVLPNDNRLPAGGLNEGVLRVHLHAGLASWRPDAGVDSTVTVQAFSERDGAPRIPGPLLRATSGTEMHILVTNGLDSTLVVHGLRGGTVDPSEDTVQIGPHGRREIRHVAGLPGTYVYWGTTTSSPLNDRPWRDSQLTGALVIDAIATTPDTSERIFVITALDVYMGDSVRNRRGEDIWEVAINGKSWPHTERLHYAVGDTVRWRWVNGSYLPHPMHLHGFHFRVRSRGSAAGQTVFEPADMPVVVTEFMSPGTTYAMDWVPTRAGNWLMHCHMIPHITPFPQRADSMRAHDMHDVAQHPLEGMAGLVMGITTTHRAGTTASDPTVRPARHLRLLAQQRVAGAGLPAPRGYVLQRGAEPARDSVEVPGAPLILVRGETTAITVVNRLDEPTTVHWHGMELESVFDGVSGWSGAAGNLAPLLAPGDSFSVTFTPPRAGTYMYHTHMDEGAQLVTGMYGPLLVLEPGERHDSLTDHTIMIGRAVVSDTVRETLNGFASPPPLELQAGVRHRLRFVNMHPAGAALVTLQRDSATVLAWHLRGKDGADLPMHQRVEVPARLRWIGVGETYDFEWTPTEALDAELVVHVERSTLRQAVRVRPRPAPLGAQPAPPVSETERIGTHANTVAAGTLKAGVLTLALEARTGRWYPEAEDGPSLEVQAFGEPGRALSIPGPLIRVSQGTTVEVRIHNRLPTTLVLHGLHGRPGAEDAVHIAAGATREVRFAAGQPGTYFYWGSTTGTPLEDRTGIDSQLSGAFVVDPPGIVPDDRIFVIGAWLDPQGTGPEPLEVMTINGKGWPYTERFAPAVGDTLRWRWVNPTWSSHPMHLHGFYFRVDSRGTWSSDTVYAPQRQRLAVTELMLPGGTNAITWVPERAGNWLFHCHFPFHMSAGVSLGGSDTAAQHAGHDEHRMAGLVLGLHVRPEAGEAKRAAAHTAPRRLRLIARPAQHRYGDSPAMGYTLDAEGSTRDTESSGAASDSVRVPGPLLVLRQGEPVAITVVNRLAEPTTVHWHGMELESFPDGVPGWSGAANALLPAIAPGDSFTAHFTPPRAGTFIYHPHQNELQQISSGMYGALLVLAPGESWNPERDHVVIVGQAGPVVDSPGLVNGSATPAPLELRVGETHRIRLINITNDWRVMFSLVSDTAFAEWRPIAKDGAGLPASYRELRPAHLLTGPGETADFEVTPLAAGDMRLEVKTQLAGWHVPLRVRVRGR